MEKGEVIKILEIIKKSAELVLTHHEARGFKNSITEIGLKNIIGLRQDCIDGIEGNNKAAFTKTPE